jgi:hypothetical protein
MSSGNFVFFPFLPGSFTSAEAASFGFITNALEMKQ